MNSAEKSADAPVACVRKMDRSILWRLEFKSAFEHFLFKDEVDFCFFLSILCLITSERMTSKQCAEFIDQPMRDLNFELQQFSKSELLQFTSLLAETFLLLDSVNRTGHVTETEQIEIPNVVNKLLESPLFQHLLGGFLKPTKSVVFGWAVLQMIQSMVRKDKDISDIKKLRHRMWWIY